MVQTDIRYMGDFHYGYSSNIDGLWVQYWCLGNHLNEYGHHVPGPSTSEWIVPGTI
jgi:hypothetical protein